MAKCKAKTKRGTNCKAAAMNGRAVCLFHANRANKPVRSSMIDKMYRRDWQ